MSLAFSWRRALSRCTAKARNYRILKYRTNSRNLQSLITASLASQPSPNPPSISLALAVVVGLPLALWTYKVWFLFPKEFHLHFDPLHQVRCSGLVPKKDHLYGCVFCFFNIRFVGSRRFRDLLFYLAELFSQCSLFVENHTPTSTSKVSFQCYGLQREYECFWMLCSESFLLNNASCQKPMFSLTKRFFCSSLLL